MKNSLDRKMKNKYFDVHFLMQMAIVCLALAIIAFIFSFFVFFLKMGPLNYRWEIDPNKLSAVGTFVGGISGSLLSFVSVAMLIKMFDTQQEESNRKSAEDRFLQLSAAVRNIQDGMEFKSQVKSKAFSLMRIELQTFVDNAYAMRNDFAALDICYLDMAYTCFYFGCRGENSTQAVIDRFGSKEVVKQYLLNMEHRAINEKKILGDGNQHRLGHYFRSLFAAVKYVAESNISSEDEKYQLVKLLRAQLSTDEQLILLGNSMSRLGHPWREAREDTGISLIERFNLLKNIPSITALTIDVKTVYPYLDLEVSRLSQIMQAEKFRRISRM